MWMGTVFCLFTQGTAALSLVYLWFMYAIWSCLFILFVVVLPLVVIVVAGFLSTIREEQHVCNERVSAPLPHQDLVQSDVMEEKHVRRFCGQYSD